MGRHVNADAELDEHSDVTRERLRVAAYISPDTHIGFDLEVAPGTPDAAASPAHPDALIQGGQVGDGHELE